MALEEGRQLLGPQERGLDSSPAPTPRLSCAAVRLWLGLGGHCPWREECYPPAEIPTFWANLQEVPFSLKSTATSLLYPRESWLQKELQLLTHTVSLLNSSWLVGGGSEPPMKGNIESHWNTAFFFFSIANVSLRRICTSQPFLPVKFIFLKVTHVVFLAYMLFRKNHIVCTHA